MPVTTNRDLAEGELWESSLERSRRRRWLAANARKEQNRRKTASVAVTAAVAAAPMWPSVAGSGSFEARADTAEGPKQPDGPERVLLSFGDKSPTVAALQSKLRIISDGIFGPVTEAAVRDFQKRMRLPATGEVDVPTWLALFPNDAIVATSSAGAGTGEEAQWAAVTTQPTGSAPVAEAQVSASTASARPAGKARPSRGPKAHAAALAKPDEPAGDGESAVPPATGTVPPPALTPPAEGSPPAGIVTPPAAPNAPKPVLPIPPRPAPMDPGGTIGEMIRAMTAEANRIDRARYPYRWGGGHNPRFSGPYDCSGAVSAVLRAAGLLRSPLVSGGFMRWGARGRGLVTIYANASHVYMSIKGRFFGTSRSNPRGGAGWFRGGPRAGFVVVHVPFEKMKLRGRSIAKKRAKRPVRRHASIQAPRRAPRQAPQVDRLTGGTPTSAYQAPANSTPTTTPGGSPPAARPVAPAPPPAAGVTPAPPAGAAPGQGAPTPAPQRLNVPTPAGTVTVTPPPAPGTGNAPGGGSTPAAPAPAGSAPATPPAAQTPAPAQGGPGPSGSGQAPAVAKPPSAPPANPVADAAEGAVDQVGETAEAVTSAVAPKPPAQPPAAPSSGDGAPVSG